MDCASSVAGDLPEPAKHGSHIKTTTPRTRKAVWVCKGCFIAAHLNLNADGILPKVCYERTSRLEILSTGESAVDLDFLLHQAGELRGIAAPFSFRDLCFKRT